MCVCVSCFFCRAGDLPGGKGVCGCVYFFLPRRTHDLAARVLQLWFRHPELYSKRDAGKKEEEGGGGGGRVDRRREEEEESLSLEG